MIIKCSVAKTTKFYTLFICYFPNFEAVALMAGGVNYSKTVQTWSPTGKCGHLLSDGNHKSIVTLATKNKLDRFALIRSKRYLIEGQ